MSGAVMVLSNSTVIIFRVNLYFYVHSGFVYTTCIVVYIVSM